MAFARTRPDGKYLVNVWPGTYTVGTRNHTLQPYAGVTYNGPAASSATAVTGGVNATTTTPIVVTAGTSITAKFALPMGARVGGFVTDPATNPATPVPGMTVRFYDNTTGNTAGGTLPTGLTSESLHFFRSGGKRSRFDRR